MRGCTSRAARSPRSGFVSRRAGRWADPGQDRDELALRNAADKSSFEGAGRRFLHGSSCCSTARLHGREAGSTPRDQLQVASRRPGPGVRHHSGLASSLNAELLETCVQSQPTPGRDIHRDDASPTKRRALPVVSGVRYMRQPANLGFIAACNAGAAEARGRWLVFLNNDTRVVAGWLDQLIDSFELFPRAGLVGSKLFYPDGSLQEAGGIVWQDASGWNYGRDDDPNRPEYCHARQVDYVSGASIAVPADVWREMDGFDRTAPLLEDTDSPSASPLRPESVPSLVTGLHYEGKTAGPTSLPAPGLPVENQSTFLARCATSCVHRRTAVPGLERERRWPAVLGRGTRQPDQTRIVWVVKHHPF